MAPLFRFLEHCDKLATLAINSLDSSVTDPVWQFFSNKLVWVPLYLAVLKLLFSKRNWVKGLVMLLGIVLTIVACDQTANLFKEGFARLRPCHDLFMVTEGLHILEWPGNLYGFFSGHAANAAGFAMSSYLALKALDWKYSRQYAWGIIPWALLVGLSRVFVGKHFLGDVLVGFAAGLLFSYLIMKAAVWASGKLSRAQE